MVTLPIVQGARKSFYYNLEFKGYKPQQKGFHYKKIHIRTRILNSYYKIWISLSVYVCVCVSYVCMLKKRHTRIFVFVKEVLMLKDKLTFCRVMHHSVPRSTVDCTETIYQGQGWIAWLTRDSSAINYKNKIALGATCSYSKFCGLLTGLMGIKSIMFPCSWFFFCFLYFYC